MRPKKSLGQNFLMHARIAERIADVAGLTKNDTVLEIGAGKGMLTRALLARAQHVIAIEADHELIPVLHETFAKEISEKRLDVIEADVRSFDPSTIKSEYSVVANIPYYITGEIIRSFLSTKHKPASMTLLVQKEVAERITRSKKESLLSLSVKAYGTPKYQFTVPRGAFFPAPNVDSAVLSIFSIQKGAFPSEGAEKRFFDILHAGFAHKRKLLLRNLEAVGEPEMLKEVFTKIPIPEKARAEDLPLDAWKKMSALLTV